MSQSMPELQTNNAKPTRSCFSRDIDKGLSTKPMRLASKYLYDQRGSELFKKITQMDDYYVARTELGILKTKGETIKDILPEISELIEFGSGDGHKTEAILQKIMEQQSSIKYVPIDISSSAIADAKLRMENNVDGCNVEGYVGDYFSYLKAQKEESVSAAQKLYLLLGSNIGNYDSADALDFLISIQKIMNQGDFLLIGFDMKKDINILTTAYNDKDKITAEFNFNILDRINREMNANFNRQNFTHHGFYNPNIGAMQSFLISKRDHNVYVESLAKTFTFRLGEAIHLENSFKYSIHDIETMAEKSGCSVVSNLTDEKGYFTNSIWAKKSLV